MHSSRLQRKILKKSTECVCKGNDVKQVRYEEINLLFDSFIKKGFTCFDTAYTYHSYSCESTVRKCLVERAATIWKRRRKKLTTGLTD